MTTGHRLYRNKNLVRTSPAVAEVPAHTAMVPTYLCGYYPSKGVTAANIKPSTEGGIGGAPVVGPGSITYVGLDYNLLTNNPPPGFSPPGAGRPLLGSGHFYLCGNFNVPTDIGAVAGRDATFRDASVPGWDASAVSTKAFFNEGYAKFRMQPGARLLVGLQEGADPLDPKSRFYGLMTAGDFSLVNGVVRDSQSAAALTDGTAFGGGWFSLSDVATWKVSLRKNTVTVTCDMFPTVNWQYALPAEARPGVWGLGAVVYTPGAWVEGIEVRQYDAADLRLPALTMKSGILKNGARLSLPAMLVRAKKISRASMTLPALTTLGGRNIAQAAMRLPALVNRAGVNPGAVPYPGAFCRLPALRMRAGATVGSVGRAAMTMRPMKMRSGRKLAEGYLQLAPMQMSAAAEPRDQASFYGNFGTETAFSALRELVVVMNSGGTISTAVGISRLVSASVIAAATSSTPSTLSAILSAIMDTEVLAGADVPLREQAGEVWVVNLAEGAATSTFENYPFNSFATIGGHAFGAKQDGVFLLEGSDDAGAPIHASVSYGKQDFGAKTVKHMTRAYVGASSEGSLFLKVIDPDGREFVYAARGTGGALKQQRFDVGRGLSGNYFTFELFNRDGGDFEIDSVSFFAADFKRRI